MPEPVPGRLRLVLDTTVLSNFAMIGLDYRSPVESLDTLI